MTHFGKGLETRRKYAQFAELGVIDGWRLHSAAWGRVRFVGGRCGDHGERPHRRSSSPSAGFVYPSAPSSRWIYSRSLSAQTQEECRQPLGNRQTTRRGQPQRLPWGRLRGRLSRKRKRRRRNEAVTIEVIPVLLHAHELLFCMLARQCITGKARSNYCPRIQQPYHNIESIQLPVG